MAYYALPTIFGLAYMKGLLKASPWPLEHVYEQKRGAVCRSVPRDLFHFIGISSDLSHFQNSVLE